VTAGFVAPTRTVTPAAAVPHRRSPQARALRQAARLQGTVEARVALAWALLFFNILSYDNTGALIPLPNSVGKLITQGVLPVAVFVVLGVNRKAAIRPNVVMCLLSLLALEAVFTAIGTQYFLGTLFRTLRLVGFVAVLWLLTPYWGRDKMILLRTHLRVLFGFVCLSVLGLLISPGKALDSGRFMGIIWPSPATQLAHYAAATIGIVTILWLGDMMRGRTAAIMAVISLFVLLLTHTRTALLALVGALVVALISWLPDSARVRRIFAVGIAVALVVWLAASSVILSYLQRGQSAQQLSGLTGRTSFWGPLLAFPRDHFQMAFGFGISNGTFSGLPIDSNWLDSYQDQGIFGIVVCASILLFLLIAAFYQTRGVYRSLALFFVAYAIIASFTEDGITNASAYMLDIAVAASLLVPTSVSTLRPRRVHRPPAAVSEFLR
jgi:O-antigen ligase